MERKWVLDLFGGEVSQIPGAINLDIVAKEGIQADVNSPLPFAANSFDEIIVSGPRTPFWVEAIRVLKPGGRIFINATPRNRFAQLPEERILSQLGMRIIQVEEMLDPRFVEQTFRFSDGRLIPKESIRTTILEKLR